MRQGVLYGTVPFKKPNILVNWDTSNILELCLYRPHFSMLHNVQSVLIQKTS